LVVQCFLDSDVDEFKIIASELFLKLNKNPKAICWRVVISELKSKYHSLVGINRWPHKGKKPHDQEFAELQGTINALTQKVEGLKSVSNNGGGGDNKITCFNCGKEGHYQRDCPDKNDNQNNNNNGGNNNNNNKHAWKKIKHEDGQPEKKMVNGKEFMWCDKCAHWNLTHVTVKHQTKAELEAAQNNGGTNDGSEARESVGGANNGQATVAAGVGGLRLMPSLFHGVIDDRPDLN